MLKRVLLKGTSIYQQALFPYTLAGLKRKVIFVHIPKAAGTAVRVALGEPVTGRQHLPWWVYQQASPKRFKEFYKFAFVRNPLDRAFSGYNYLKSGGNQVGDLSVSDYLSRYKSFNEFVDDELSKGSMIYHPIFRPQSWYLCDWKGEIQVDFVGKFESIDSDFENVARNLKLSRFKGLDLVNKSPAKCEEISKHTEHKILEIYKNDYKVFGY
ncbi:sulfotransferase family 2 domain-containing protein [Marinobacter sp. DUT-1]|uniref:sulfotransferase family 2 domain-containing protein n=1 Tax=Marinobacter sp. DUT-1 TaxID=3412037 RepID=UPI003D17B690